MRHAYEELKTERDDLEQKAKTDKLTGLPNRLALDEWLKPRVESLLRHRQGRAKRSDETTSLVMGMIDIDHFKQVNDLRGHDVGDKALAWMAGTARDYLRDSDLLARTGGEEFTLVFDGAGLEAALERSQGLVRHIEHSSVRKMAEWGITDRPALTVSLGLAEFDNDCASSDEVLVQADNALYAAKETGRNRVVVYGPDMPVKPQAA